MKYILALGAALIGVACAAQQQQYTTPVPILKQINKHNEDGSYSYGYEGADGSFKIETKYANGEVFGKYGYVDDTGKVREVEYGASRRGFEPAGSHINVAPPTLKQQDPNNNYLAPLGPDDEDDGQYREDPSAYYKSEPAQPTSRYQQPAYQQPAYQAPAYKAPTYQAPAYKAPTYQKPVSRYQQPTYQEPEYQEPSYDDRRYQQPASQQPQYRPQPSYRPQSVFNSDFFRSFNSATPRYNNPAPVYNNPAPVYNNPAPRYNNPAPRYNNYNPGNNYNNLPLQNVDLNTGSYSVNY